MNDALRPLIRRAILDTLEDIGGEVNDDVIAVTLNQLGHRLARRHVATELRWLAEHELVRLETFAPFLIAEITADGRDVSRGRLQLDGVSKHRTGG